MGIILYVHLGSFSGCDWTVEGWGCCSSSQPCGILEGDCDSDNHCLGNLTCGSNNCLDIFPSEVDCCDDPYVNSTDVSSNTYIAATTSTASTFIGNTNEWYIILIMYYSKVLSPSFYFSRTFFSDF